MRFFLWTMTQRFPKLLQRVGRKCLQPHLSFTSGSNSLSMTFLFCCKYQQYYCPRESNLPFNIGRILICTAFSDRHKQTHHQYYLQLRRDLLEERLCCHEDTALYLGALALQTECGDCMPEVLHQAFKLPCNKSMLYQSNSKYSTNFTCISLKLCCVLLLFTL